MDLDNDAAPSIDEARRRSSMSAPIDFRSARSSIGPLTAYKMSRVVAAAL
jgi:hypothetical protein